MSFFRKLFSGASASDARDAHVAAGQSAEGNPSKSPVPQVLDVSRVIADARASEAAGRSGKSLALINDALRATPGHAQLEFARAGILFRWGRFHESRASALRAGAAGCRDVALFLQLGWTCFCLGSVSEAESWMRKAVAADPDAWEPHFNLGVVLRARGSASEAVACHQRALELNPDEIDCLVNLGGCRIDEDMPGDAELDFRRAIAVRPESAAAWNLLGVALGLQSRDDEARAAFERAFELDAEHAGDVDAFINLAINLRDAQRLPLALALFESRLVQRPDVHGHLSYAHALLTAGRLREGWIQLEFRWLKEPLLSRRANFPRPVWSGQDLRGKSILLRVEQGFGDSIQFLRYAPAVKALGATVLLRISDELTDLLRHFPGVDLVLGLRDPCPEFDYYIHLVSLPRVFGTDLDSVPASVPYLHADPARIARWLPRLGTDDTVKVGLVWGGSPAHERDRFRTMSLRTLAPLGEVSGARFFSLQKGLVAEEAKAPPPGFDVVNLSPEIRDFSDTAAVIAHLDLVICVDTSVAHLAGAMGKPVWIMLPWPSDWRWLETREDTPWYPTMRLFRQNRREDWDEVVGRVKLALAEVTHGDSPVPTAAGGDGNAAGKTPIPCEGTDALARLGSRPGLSAVAEIRDGILQYFPDDGPAGMSIGWYGEYLEPQLALLLRMVKPGSTLIEVGGVGEHSLRLAAALGGNGHLILYEARPAMQQVLRQNMGSNRIGNCTVMRRGLGPRESSIPADGESQQAGDMHGAAHRAGGSSEIETVDALQLDRLNWIKVNHGVSALDVLAGAEETIWRQRPWLFLGASDMPAMDAVARRVEGFSYRCWRMETPLFNPDNFNCRGEDIFAGRSALALVAFPEEVDVDIALDGCVALS